MLGLYQESNAEEWRDWDFYRNLRKPAEDGSLYREILRQLSENKDNIIVKNDTFDDSISVYERFFLDAEKHIHIIARGIRSEIFDNTTVINAASKFLSRENTHLHFYIRIRNNDEYTLFHKSKFIETINKANNNIKYNFYKDRLAKPFLHGLPSLTVADDRMYRKRVYQEDGDYNNNANADVNFNDPNTTKELFEHLLSHFSEEDRFKPSS